MQFGSEQWRNEKTKSCEATPFLKSGQKIKLTVAFSTKARNEVFGKKIENDRHLTQQHEEKALLLKYNQNKVRSSLHVVSPLVSSQ